MQAIIPVAGIGSRLKPHTHTVPKVLLQVADKPILGHILDELIRIGVNDAIFVTGHLGDAVTEYVTEKYPQINSVFVEQAVPQGLGHAIYTALPAVTHKDVFIILGDTVFDVDLSTVFKKNVSSLGVKEVEDPRRFGVALLDGNKIAKLIEKPKTPISNLAIVGLYYINDAEALKTSLNYIVDNDIRTNNEIQLTDALQHMLTTGHPMEVFEVEGWYDCGKPETLLSTNKFLLIEKQNNPVYENVVIIPPVYIDPSAKIDNSIIGPDVTIGENAVVHKAIIKYSIINHGATIEKILIENSIIGEKSLVRGVYNKLNTGDSTEIEFN